MQAVLFGTGLLTGLIGWRALFHQSGEMFNDIFYAFEAGETIWIITLVAYSVANIGGPNLEARKRIVGPVATLLWGLLVSTFIFFTALFFGGK